MHASDTAAAIDGSAAAPAKRVYLCNGGPPYVIATCPDEVRVLLASDAAGHDIALSCSIDLASGDEMFTMLYAEVDDGDPVEEECEHGCEDFHNHVTTSMKEWAEVGWGIDSPVAWEFEG